jgi:hypothetical protein
MYSTNLRGVPELVAALHADRGGDEEAVPGDVLAEGQVGGLGVLELHRGRDRGDVLFDLPRVELEPRPQRIAFLAAEHEALEDVHLDGLLKAERPVDLGEVVEL